MTGFILFGSPSRSLGVVPSDLPDAVGRFLQPTILHFIIWWPPRASFILHHVQILFRALLASLGFFFGFGQE